jgi:hypothetical protein
MAIEYPTWRYHATEEPCVVHSADEDAKLGQGWHDAPVEPKAEPVSEPDSAPKKGKKK